MPGLENSLPDAKLDTGATTDDTADIIADISNSDIAETDTSRLSNTGPSHLS